MRRISTFVGRIAGLAEPTVPHARLERVNQALRRRLDDAVEEVFTRACLTGDLDTAADLLAVLKNMHARRQQRVGRDRRLNDTIIQAATQELERRQRAQAATRGAG